MASAAGWLACQAPLSERAARAGRHRSEIWVQRAQRSYFVGTEQEKGGSGGSTSSWSCGPIEPGPAAAAVCSRCRWFDTSSPGPSADASATGHLDLNVSPAECLLGSFADPSDAQAWLHRDLLVHRGRYAAECVPSVSVEWWRIAAAIALLFLFGWLACTCQRRQRPFRGRSGSQDAEAGPGARCSKMELPRAGAARRRRSLMPQSRGQRPLPAGRRLPLRRSFKSFTRSCSTRWMRRRPSASS